MKKKNSICEDIRRSLSLLLVLTILCGMFTPVLATAADESRDFYVYDMNKSIGIYYYDNPYSSSIPTIGFSTKYFQIDNINGFDMEDRTNLQMNGDVFLLDENGQEKKIFSYVYNRMYGTSSLYSNDINVVMLLPVFYDNAGNKLAFNDWQNVDFSDTGSRPLQNNHPDEHGIWGLHPDFKNYMIDKFGEENVSAETVYSFLLSENMNGKLYIRLTLTDGNGKTGTEILSGYNMTDLYMDTYSGQIGLVLGYSRIEDMTDYHEENTYDYLKMYKGNLYIDADKIGALKGSIALPNYNNTNLRNMNSIYIDNNRVWYDGLKNITITESYNINSGIFPEGAITTMDDAIYHYLFLCNSETETEDEEGFLKLLKSLGYEKDDYGSDELFDDAKYTWISAVKYGFLKSDREYDFISLDKQYVYKKEGTDISFESYIIGDLSDTEEDFWNSNDYMVDSLSLPSIPLNISNSGEELREKLNKYKEYLDEMKNFLYYNGFSYIIYEDLYSGEFENTDKSKYYTLDDVITIVDEIIDLLDNDVTDLSGLSGELEDLIGFRATFDDYSFEYKSFYFYDKPDALMDIASELGIKTGIKGYYIKEQVLDEISEIMSYLRENDGLIDSFGEELISKVMISRKHCELNIEESSHTMSELPVVVDSDEIRIPLQLLNQNLGKDNIISNYYYAAANKNTWIWSVKSYKQSEGTMLYKGEKKLWGYQKFQIMPGNTLPNEFYWHVIPYSSIDALYYNELTNMKFAKKPGMVMTENEEYSTKNAVTLTWSEPEDNGAEIIGYQIAVVPKGQKVTEADFLDLSELEYKDLGDNYVIPYTTSECSYSILTGYTSKDVYIRAVNVIGVGDYKKITVNNELELRIIGPDEVHAGDSNVDYNTVDFDNNNVEPNVTYSLKDNPDKVSIDADGRLTVDKDCKLDSVTIISTGKSGTEYEGRSAYKDVRIIKPEPEKTTEPDTTPEPDMTVNPPKTGDETNLMYFLVLEAVSGTLMMVGGMLYRKKKEY